MAKTQVNPGQADFIRLQKDLASQGINSEHIDRLLTKSGGIEEIFKDVPALRGYFTNAAKVLGHITQWDYDFINSKAVPGSVASPSEFKQYFANSYESPTPVPFRDFIPAQYFENPQLLVPQKVLSQEQADALQILLHGGGHGNPGQNQAVDWSEPSSNPGGGQSGYPGSKSYGTAQGDYGGGPYGGGASKAYSSNKSYGGGGLPGPPPGGGGPYGGGYNDYGGGVPQPDMSKERAYIDTLKNDPNYGLLDMLFYQDYGFRSFGATIMQQLENVRAQKRALTNALANLDPTDPRQAQQLRIISQQQAELGDSERTLMEKLGIANRAKDEMITLMKSMMDVNFKTMQTIISNTKG